MFRLNGFFLYLFIVSLLWSCTKTMDNEDPSNPPVGSPGNPGKPNGSLFINVVGYFIKINAADSSMVWGSETRNLFASFDNPMTFDTTAFYHGNYSAITAYSAQTGQPKWTVSWPAFNDAITYRKPAFKGENVLFTAPSSMWDHGYLYCADKNSGAIKWKVQLDYGFASYPFNTTPMVSENTVIVMTRDAENHKRLTAFNIADGVHVWNSEINDNLSFHLRLENGKIYSTTNQYAISYNAANGQMLWQTDLMLAEFKLTASFFEKDRLILVKVKGTDYSLLTIDLANGSITKKASLNIPTQIGDPDFAPMGSAYLSNKLFIATRYHLDLIKVKAYDFSTLSLKWEKNIKNYLYTSFTPTVTDKYLIFPVNDSYPDGKSLMHFYNHDGKFVTGIPFNGNYTAGFIYNENGVLYTQDHIYLDY